MNETEDSAFAKRWSSPTMDVNTAALRFNPQGDVLAVALANGLLKCYGVAEGRELAAFSTNDNRASACNDVCWYPTGQFLFIGKEDGNVIVHDCRLGKLHAAMLCHSAAVTYLLAHPKSPLLISCSVDSTLRFWDIRSSSPLLTVSSGGHALYAMDCDIDGMRLATGGVDGFVRIWDITTAMVFDVLPGDLNRTPITSIQFSSDGEYVLVSRQEWPVKLWKTSTKMTVRSFAGSKNLFYMVRSRMMGKYVVSGSEDGNVFVWDCLSTDLVAKLPHKPAVLAVDCCEKNMLIASASVGQGGSVNLWSQNVS
uniref:WD_REPEATS_REGION domain-containing protein n=1 Tax=Trichuris muris TaxID=70415 RepID=A0A5S6Q6M3_TRIMR